MLLLSVDQIPQYLYLNETLQELFRLEGVFKFKSICDLFILHNFSLKKKAKKTTEFDKI